MLLDLCPEETEPGSYDEYGVSCICGAVEFVKRMPAVNAAPVVHGRWHEGNAMNGHDDIYCSNCGIDATYFANGCDGIYWSNENPNYCPNCGARMDG